MTDRDPLAVYELRCPACRRKGGAVGRMADVNVEFDSLGNVKGVSRPNGWGAEWPSVLQCLYASCHYQGAPEDFFLVNQWQDEDTAIRLAGVFREVAQRVRSGATVAEALDKVASRIAPEGASDE